LRPLHSLVALDPGVASCNNRIEEYDFWRGERTCVRGITPQSSPDLATIIGVIPENARQSFRGNPLFLRQILIALQTQEGCIYVNLSYPRWDWDLEKIGELKIPETVLALFRKEMEKLHPQLQLGLIISSSVWST